MNAYEQMVRRLAERVRQDYSRRGARAILEMVENISGEDRLTTVDSGHSAINLASDILDKM